MRWGMQTSMAAIFLALCACASAPAKQEKVVLYSTPGAPTPDGKVICSVERPTGSNIAERICRYENQADWSSERAQDALLEMQRRACTGTGVCTAN